VSSTSLSHQTAHTIKLQHITVVLFRFSHNKSITQKL